MKACKLKIAFFASSIESDSLRGAARLFRALIDGLAKRNDIDLYILFERFPPEFNPVSSIFKVKRYKDVVLEGSTFSSLQSVTGKGIRKSLKTIFEKTRKKYRALCPRPLRIILRPLNYLTHKILKIIYNTANSYLSKYQERRLRHGHLNFFSLEFFREIISTQKEAHESNKDIVSEYSSINEFDVVLNFWWFHTKNSNELIGLSKNSKTLTYSWFLDAIPIRIPHWQEGLIAESTFRNHIQTHLEISDRIVAISHSAANDAQEIFSISEEKITVVPCGIYNEDFIVVEGQSSINIVLKKYNIQDGVPIVLAIGLQEPSKNIINVIKACFKLLQSGFSEFQLVIIGEHIGFNPHERFGEVLKKLSGSIHVVFTGGVSEKEKHILLSATNVFLYPSLWEGFGIPPLEAMAASVPVLVSDIASLPEVCKDYVWYCDPYDSSDIAEKLQEILKMGFNQRAFMTERAQKYAKEWLWETKAIPELVEDINKQLSSEKFNKSL